MSRRPAPVSYAASLVVEQPLADARPMAVPQQINRARRAHHHGEEMGHVTATSCDAQALFPQQHPAAIDGGIGAGQGRARRPLENVADPSVLYLHPAGKKALRLYAVERHCKVHDLLLEAVENWAASKGLAGPWRVPSAGPPRRRR